jgi:hypothetical protein
MSRYTEFNADQKLLSNSSSSICRHSHTHASQQQLLASRPPPCSGDLRHAPIEFIPFFLRVGKVGLRASGRGRRKASAYREDRHDRTFSISAREFTRVVEVIADRIGDRVRHNPPMCQSARCTASPLPARSAGADPNSGRDLSRRNRHRAARGYLPAQRRGVRGIASRAQRSPAHRQYATSDHSTSGRRSLPIAPSLSLDADHGAHTVLSAELLRKVVTA